jgi:hypothetical protein
MLGIDRYHHAAGRLGGAQQGRAGADQAFLVGQGDHRA